MALSFLQISLHTAKIPTCEGILSKPRIDTDTMFLLKIAQAPRLHLHKKKIIKLAVLVCLQEIFLIKTICECFSSLTPYISELRPNTESMVS